MPRTPVPRPNPLGTVKGKGKAAAAGRILFSTAMPGVVVGIFVVGMLEQ